MHRCLQLAKLGEGSVAPNPMVGAVLVYQDQIIGEGYHKEYGQSHAEVNCIRSVLQQHQHLIKQSTLYVSLEPCAHFGKTPPCADLIIQHKIPSVVVGCRDPFLEVNGKGLEKLKATGVSVMVGVLEEECKELNKRFFIFHTQHRPFIRLKWAQTKDGKIAAAERHTRLLISNQYSNRIVHQWRSQEMAILVGTNTALFDDPELATRLWPGVNPIRIVIDMHLRLPKSLKLFDGIIPTLVFNLHRHTTPFEKITADELKAMRVAYHQVTEDASLVHQMMNALYRMNIQSVLVEGGAHLLQSFIDEGVWDEAAVITNEKLEIGSGLPAPILKKHQLKSLNHVATDAVRIYQSK